MPELGPVFLNLEQVNWKQNLLEILTISTAPFKPLRSLSTARKSFTSALNISMDKKIKSLPFRSSLNSTLVEVSVFLTKS